MGRSIAAAVIPIDRPIDLRRFRPGRGGPRLGRVRFLAVRHVVVGSASRSRSSRNRSDGRTHRSRGATHDREVETTSLVRRKVVSMSRVEPSRSPGPSLWAVALTTLVVLAVVCLGLALPAASAAPRGGRGLSASADDRIDGQTRDGSSSSLARAGERETRSDVTLRSGRGRCSTLYHEGSVRRVCLYRVVDR